MKLSPSFTVKQSAGPAALKLKRSAGVQYFSLVELLVVIAIIALLAGLMIPAIQSGKTRGQITQAKADMTAIKMALLGVERDYKTIFNLDGNGNVDDGDIAETAVKYDSNKTHVVRYNASNMAKYNALIKELSVPRDVTAAKKNFNVRNIKYLDPRSDYDDSITAADNPTLWRDPWGSPYDISVCTDSTEKVYIPYDKTNKVLTEPGNHDGENQVLRGKVFVYSYGPNGENDGSFSADNGGKSTTDDVRGWEK